MSLKQQNISEFSLLLRIYLLRSFTDSSNLTDWKSRCAVGKDSDLESPVVEKSIKNVSGGPGGDYSRKVSMSDTCFSQNSTTRINHNVHAYFMLHVILRNGTLL